jgi:N-acetyl-gamma-glutamyl-phosphate reductase/acetylglutamate kinase
MLELVTRSKLAKATRISPLVPHLGGDPTIFGVSGYSGAGTKPSPKNDTEQLRDNLMPYSLTDHVHEREIGVQLDVSVGFIPHVASWFQGIHHTINIPLNKEMSSRDIRNLYQDRYAGERLIKIVGEAPLVKNISGKHGVVSFLLLYPTIRAGLIREARKSEALEFTPWASASSSAPPSTTSSRVLPRSACRT